MAKKKDVMESILGADEKEFECKTRELDFLIYRSKGGTDSTPVAKPASPSSWKVSKGRVSVEFREGKAKIKIKTGPGFSMKRLVRIAVDAILAELEKEDSQ